MTWHLIRRSNLITHYFGMKTVRFESQEYTFLNKIIYLTSGLSGLSTNQVEQSVGLAILVCSLENVTFWLEEDGGRNHF